MLRGVFFVYILISEVIIARDDVFSVMNWYDFRMALLRWYLLYFQCCRMLFIINIPKDMTRGLLIYSRNTIKQVVEISFMNIAVN